MSDDERPERGRTRMSKAGNRLTMKAIENKKALQEPGRYHDGHGLYLQVTDSGKKSWLLRYERGGKEHMLGLGPLHTVTLKQARERAKAVRLQLLDGTDPLAAKRQRRLDAAATKTFRQATEQYIVDKGAGWSASHRHHWEQMFRDFVHPAIGDLPVAAVDTDAVVRVLRPIWSSMQSAQRLRGRIEQVLGWATAMKFRTGDNPATWRGHLANLLPKPSAVHTAKHHAAMPYADLPALMAELRATEGTVARALEFAILTAARTGEVLGATWSEVDLKARTWTIPAERMKMDKEHRVPLSPRAVEILEALPREDGNPRVVISERRGRPVGNRALFVQLSAVRPGLTVHGFRSTFRDWVGDRTHFPREVAEAALAHSIGNGTEAAYRRGTAFDKRRALMEAWEQFCLHGEPEGNVIPFQQNG